MKPALSKSLQTKRKDLRKPTEILSFTNAAVEALSAANSTVKPQKKVFSSLEETSKHGQALEVHSISSSTDDMSLVQDQNDVLALGTNTSSSLSTCQSTSGQEKTDSKTDLSSLDSSFNRSTAQRVRIPSRLLREIKSPQDRSVVPTGSLQTDVQQPAALVVRHIDGPSAWVSMATTTLKPDDGILTHRDQGATSTTTVLTHEVTKVKDLDEQEQANQQPVSTIYKVQSGEENGRDEVEHTNEPVKNPSVSVLKKGSVVTCSGLCQGDPITGDLISNAKSSDSIKAKTFSLSERERVLKEEFMKRKDVKSAPVKRVVQPTIVTSNVGSLKPDDATSQNNPVVSAAAIAAAAASAATAPFLQIQHGLESQISTLVNALHVLHEQQHKLEHQKVAEQESRLQEQLDARLKKLEEVQKQLLESKNIQPRCSPNSNVPDIPYPCLSQTATSISSSQDICVTSQRHPRLSLTTSVDSVKQPTSYIPAAQHFTQKAVHTQTSSAARDAALKFKLIKNTKTQTSPQDSSVLLSDSPLQTPLPRKRPPLPMFLDNSQKSHAQGHQYHELPSEKRVHFSDPDHHYPASRMLQPSYGFAGIQSQPIHHVTNRPTPCLEADFQRKRINIQEKEKLHSSDLAGARQVIDDLNVIKKDLQSVMVETEKIKDNLSSEKIKGPGCSFMMDMAYQSILEIAEKFSQVNKGPSPLDAYLLMSDISKTIEKAATGNLTAAPVVQHYVDAERILRNVQMKRDNLESNLNAIVRQSDEDNLYAAVDSMIQEQQGVETFRIRKNVDRIIKELNFAVKKEIEIECKSSEVQSQSTTATNQDYKKPKAKYPPSTGMLRRPARKTPGKENLPEPKTNAKKTKTAVKPSLTRSKTAPKPESRPVSKLVSRPVSKPDSFPQPETYLASVYGRPSYHPQRLTSKAPYLHYQSPVNPRTAALTSAILGTGSRQPSSKPALPESPKPTQITSKEAIQRKEKTPRYYFHPDMNVSHVLPTGEGRVNLDAPVEGHLAPMAIPLGKPKTDQSLRLPLTTTTTTVLDTERTARSSSPVSYKKLTPSRPNVAVITVRDKEIEDESTDHRERRGKSRYKGRTDLGVQILPPMDIDSFTESSDGLVDTPIHMAHVSDVVEPYTRPDNAEYEDFRNYLTVSDTNPQERDDEDEPRIPTPENPLTIEGHTEKDHLYHGPPFPPQYPSLTGNLHPGVLEAETRVNDALEARAVEWVEQELLARIVSEMNRPLPDPTLVTRREPDPSPDSSVVTDDGDMLAATIGLGGIQLFVDAGIPVDRDFVATLIRDVIAEQIVSTLGYPKPTATPRPPQEDIQEETRSPKPVATPVSTPLPTPVYTPVESESSEPHSPPLATPDPTPVPSESSDAFESEGEPIPVKELSGTKPEQSESEVSETRSPVPTPVATPVSSHTPSASVSTPEPSTREPESDVGSPVLTPQATEETPSPPPEPSIVSTPPVDSSVATPKPPTVTSSPSSMTTSTMSTPGTTSTMTTIDEELSEGQLLQPYIHMGQFSEGEYTAAYSPGVGRTLLPDEALGMLGNDEDSRNHLIRVALHGLLGRNLGSSSSTVSTASTLKETHDIIEDSLADDCTPSEGEIVFRKDQNPTSYGLRTTIPDHTVQDSASSEGELVATHRFSGTSPGEFRPVMVENVSARSPGEINTRQSAHQMGSPENTESRSLHTSDLQQKERRLIRTRQLVLNGEGTTLQSQGEKEVLCADMLEESDKEIGKSASRSPPPPIHVPMFPLNDSSLNVEERTGDEQDTYGDVSSISGGDF